MYPENAPLVGGTTALMIAAKNGHYDIVEVLLDAGALVNIVNAFGHHALFHAVINNHPNIVRLLLDRGSNKDTIDFFGNKPETYAQPEVLNMF
jgi:ankyrin repeat protein